MEKNDTILKYLSGLLEEKEKADFEKRLASDSALKSEFKRISDQLNELRVTPELEEEYFADLEQKVREASSHSSKHLSHGFSLALGTLFSVLIIFAVVNFVFNKTGDNINSVKLSSEIKIESNELAYDYSIDDLENLGITADDYLSAGISEISENDLISYFNETDFGDISDYFFVENTTSENLSEMINKLKNIKY